MLHKDQRFITYEEKQAFDKVTSETEVQNYKKLGTWYNIPKLYHVREMQSGESHIIIERIEDAVTIENLTKTGVNPEELLHIIRDTKATLKYMHSRKVVHGDLGEARNWLYQKETKRLVLIDFESEYDPENSESDIESDYTSAALILFLIFHGELDQDIYDSIVDDDYSELISLIESDLEEYRNDNLVVTILKEILDCFKNTGIRIDYRGL